MRVAGSGAPVRLVDGAWLRSQAPVLFFGVLPA
jgi:hypothetical protein